MNSALAAKLYSAVTGRILSLRRKYEVSTTGTGIHADGDVRAESSRISIRISALPADRSSSLAVPASNTQRVLQTAVTT